LALFQSHFSGEPEQFGKTFLINALISEFRSNFGIIYELTLKKKFDDNTALVGAVDDVYQEIELSM
jgi:hypothetical protein